MYGAILGDIIGSPYEFDMGDKTKDFPLFSEDSYFTDDTVMTIAVAEAFMSAPDDENVIRQRLGLILEHAGIKKIRFHDLRHTFATNALKHGMDVKTLSTIIGHISSRTTLNVYAHVTDEMKQKAAVTIDRGIGKAEPQETPQTPPMKTMTDFQPTKRTRRKPGTGYIKQNHEHRWSGRCTMKWPDGSTRIRTISGETEEECEEKLAALIAEMKAERARLKEESVAS